VKFASYVHRVLGHGLSVRFGVAGDQMVAQVWQGEQPVGPAFCRRWDAAVKSGDDFPRIMDDLCDRAARAAEFARFN
jgi:hypothetical protein